VLQGKRTQMTLEEEAVTVMRLHAWSRPLYVIWQLSVVW